MPVAVYISRIWAVLKTIRVWFSYSVHVSYTRCIVFRINGPCLYSFNLACVNVVWTVSSIVRLHLDPPDPLDSLDDDLPLGLSRLNADAGANGSAPLILECDVTMRVDDGTANAFFTFRNRLMMRLLRWSARYHLRHISTLAILLLVL